MMHLPVLLVLTGKVLCIRGCWFRADSECVPEAAGHWEATYHSLAGWNSYNTGTVIRTST